jgi:TolB-like protein/DNA-binding winged helix-turn-helix (wHTH) protein/tetratricopeptide (TPR) repeat protein
VTDPRPDAGSTRINLAEEPDFELGDLRVLPAQRAVEHSGQRQELQPRVMQVLVALAKARPAVLSRDRLVDLCWDGRIVGDDALNRCILSLRQLARQFAPEPFEIRTVPRIGHRLVAAGKQPDSKIASPRWILAAMVVILLAIAMAAAVWRQGGSSQAPASIAVMPFRNLGGGDPYFAAGIGEEILGQLAREPHFRVAGRSSASQFGDNPDIRQVGERLNVDYVLEGSVRRQGDQVRVDAGLVRASDGMRLWTDSYDGSLDDIFAIQRQVAVAIASSLERKLLQAPELSGPLVTNGEAYNLYLTARGLLRTNNRRVGATAADLLRDALRIDPNYAPAWAGLADATRLQSALGDQQDYVEGIRRSRSFANRALELAPDLADAHAALAETYGYGDPAGAAHFKRATALDPNNARNLLAIAATYADSGAFERELEMDRRAHEVDPLWYSTTGQTAIDLAELGNRAGAEATARRDMPDKGANLNIALGRIAWIFGDYSEAGRRWGMVARSGSPRWAHTAERTLRDATHAVGVNLGQPEDIPQPISSRNNWRVWMETAPTPAVWRARNRDQIAAAVYRKHNLVAAKLMLNAGRGDEIVATYDSAVGLQGMRRGQRLRVDQLAEAPLLALALRATGRGVEAQVLLREAESLGRSVQDKCKVPFWFDAQSAAILAVEGKDDEALSLLERAFARGWRLNDGGDLRSIDEEPVFRPLRGETRFKRLQGQLAAHYARERRELEAVVRSQKPALNSTPS